jgi:hypothetical protein
MATLYYLENGALHVIELLCGRKMEDFSMSVFIKGEQ